MNAVDVTLPGKGNTQEYSSGHASREYILVHPWIDGYNRFISAYRMQEKQAIILEASSSNFHILIVILKAYMLKHSDRDNMIKRIIEIPVR